MPWTRAAFPRGWLPGSRPGLILVFPLEQAFSASPPQPFGARHSSAGGGCCPVRGRMFSSIPGVYPGGAWGDICPDCQLHLSVDSDNQKCLQTSPHVP